jgi:hypothetical protein
LRKTDIQEAHYLPQVVEDYKGNPLIEALPPIYSPDKAARLLAATPLYNEGERELDNEYREHCIHRLFSYFQPLNTHIDIEKRVSMSIRQGYISKNPATPQYTSKLAQGSAAIDSASGEWQKAYIPHSTASGFTIIGMSGVGKTTAIERVLSLYPQRILHTQYNDEPLFMTQMVWAKLDCPFDGSLKGLCFSFFAYVDKVLGTDYSKKFAISRMTVDSALPRMAQIATTHCLGLLVIDEIQHLSQARSGGKDKMLNFFVTLVNTVGVPVVLIGTSKALPILQSEFRQARRSSGQQGALIWERMQNDISWDIMLRAMWKNQWTRKRTLLTDELKNTLYDESQGIIDIAVKLYAFAQAKAIGDGTEEVTVAAIREVASIKLSILKEYLDALRSGDVRKMAQYEDITPITVDDYIAAQFNRAPNDVDFGKEAEQTLEAQAVIKLLELDIPSKVARTAVKKAIGKATIGQPLASIAKKAFKIALNMDAEKDGVETVEQDSDLRKSVGEAAYDNLKQSGVIADTDDEFS